jgi:hypothetical protein
MIPTCGPRINGINTSLIFRVSFWVSSDSLSNEYVGYLKYKPFNVRYKSVRLENLHIKNASTSDLGKCRKTLSLASSLKQISFTMPKMVSIYSSPKFKLEFYENYAKSSPDIIIKDFKDCVGENDYLLDDMSVDLNDLTFNEFDNRKSESKEIFSNKRLKKELKKLHSKMKNECYEGKYENVFCPPRDYEILDLDWEAGRKTPKELLFDYTSPFYLSPCFLFPYE